MWRRELSTRCVDASALGTRGLEVEGPGRNHQYRGSRPLKPERLTRASCGISGPGLRLRKPDWEARSAVRQADAGRQQAVTKQRVRSLVADQSVAGRLADVSATGAGRRSKWRAGVWRRPPRNLTF